MADNSQRKSFFILALALSVAVAGCAGIAAVIADEELRERLGSTYYILGFAIAGCVLLILAGYAWDRTLIQRLKSLGDQVPEAGAAAGTETGLEADQDEVIGLARKIERMAQALQKTEASYRGIVEDQIDLICRYRTDGRLTFVNGACAAAFGRRRNEMLGQPFEHFVPEASSSESDLSFEREMDSAAGRRWLRWTLRPIKDSTGTTLEYQAVGHDITDSKQAEATLRLAKETAEAADRAKTEFLAVVSHEIRTPINGVIGFAQLLSESPLSTEQREQVALIKSSGQALEKLIADILDLSKIEAGKIEIEHAAFGLRQCVEDVISFFQPKARAAALALTATIEPDVPTVVHGDESRLRQVLTNLIGNAIKFTERGSITISLSGIRGEAAPGAGLRREIRLFFAVTDTGVGIPAEKLSRLFKPFSQVDAAADRRRSGTGLGLIISKRLCDLMGGSISVDSKPGAGTTFRFSIVATYEPEGTRPAVSSRAIS